MMGSLEREARRLDPFLIAERPVFARLITNADLERKEEMEDEQAELRLKLVKLVGDDIAKDDGSSVHLPGEIDECEDEERRRELRAEARAISKEMRRRDALMMALYVEDENGDPFSDEQLLNLPFRVAHKLSVRATAYAFGVEDEEQRPTPATSGSG